MAGLKQRWPECFVKMLFYSDIFALLGTKKRLAKSVSDNTSHSKHFGLRCKLRHRVNGLIKHVTREVYYGIENVEYKGKDLYEFLPQSLEMMPFAYD